MNTIEPVVSTQAPPESPQGCSVAPVAGQSYKRQIDAVAYLNAAGYRVSKSLFNTHYKRGLIPRSAAGLFEASALLGYAAVNLTPTERIGDAQAQAAAVDKLSAEADLRAIRAERERLKLHRESGRLMPVRDHEDQLAARAVFFRAEVESFIHRLGPRIIDLVRGEPERLQDLIIWWAEATADWMDAWSSDRDFMPEDTEDEVEA